MTKKKRRPRPAPRTQVVVPCPFTPARAPDERIELVIHIEGRSGYDDPVSDLMWTAQEAAESVHEGAVAETIVYEAAAMLDVTTRPECVDDTVREIARAIGPNATVHSFRRAG